MATSKEWSRGYAKQAKADFDVRVAICRQEKLPSCMQLHFLQMACEKLAKAYLCGVKGADPKKLQTSHKYIAKVIPEILYFRISNSDQRMQRNRRLMSKVRQWAREIEPLAPAVDDNNRRPENSEYPWEDAHGKLFVPAEFHFANLNGLNTAEGISFLKFLYAISVELGRD